MPGQFRIRRAFRLKKKFFHFVTILELVRKTSNASIEHENPFGTFQPGKQDITFSEVLVCFYFFFFFFRNFPVMSESKKHYFTIDHQIQISGMFDKMENV